MPARLVFDEHDVRAVEKELVFGGLEQYRVLDAAFPPIQLEIPLVVHAPCLAYGEIRVRSAAGLFLDRNFKSRIPNLDLQRPAVLSEQRRVVHLREPFAPEYIACGWPDLPVPMKEPHHFDVWECKEVSPVLRILACQRRVVVKFRGDECQGPGRHIRVFCGEFFGRIGPPQNIVDPDKPPDNPGPFRDREPGFLIDPPFD